MKAVLPRSVRSTAKNWRSGYKKGAYRYWKGPCGSIVIYEVFINKVKINMALQTGAAWTKASRTS